MIRGWWSIKYEAVDEEFREPNRVDLEHIAKCIVEGYTSGEILCDDDEYEEEEEKDAN